MRGYDSSSAPWPHLNWTGKLTILPEIPQSSTLNNIQHSPLNHCIACLFTTEQTQACTHLDWISHKHARICLILCFKGELQCPMVLHTLAESMGHWCHPTSLGPQYKRENTTDSTASSYKLKTFNSTAGYVYALSLTEPFLQFIFTAFHRGKWPD